MPEAIIIGIGSDIGRELALRFSADRWSVAGTLRGRAAGLPPAARLVACDLASNASVESAIQALRADAPAWDVIVVAAGTEEPVGEYWECDGDAWEEGVRVNALGPLRLVRGLYPSRNRGAHTAVAFFSGAGSNGPAPSYSAYSGAKVLLMKMCELLDAESPDTSFFIIGPGIVRTKIHEQTLRAPARSGANYRKVVDFLASPDPGTSHDDIYGCLRWCMAAGKRAVGGRNLALVHDAWRDGGAELLRRLEADPNLYKLRRAGNDPRMDSAKK